MLTREENELLCRVEGDAPMGRLMRALFGIGTPRGLQGAAVASSRVGQLPQLADWCGWTMVRRILNHGNSIFASALNRAPTTA